MTENAMLKSDMKSQIRQAIDTKTKPLGSLGVLEDLALQIGLLQGTLQPQMDACLLCVFVADHGVAANGVSAYPQAVTQQMLANLVAGGAASTVFAKTVGVEALVVDAGVAAPASDHPNILNRRIAAGTQNFLSGPAMTAQQRGQALTYGQAIATRYSGPAMCFGEMGIGNTSSAALLAHKITGLPLSALIGRGTGVDDAGLAAKKATLAAAADRTASTLSAEDALAEYGGFEIAMMAGAMMAAAKASKLVLVDGFIATSAALIASAVEPACAQAFVYTHVSADSGHRPLLDALGAKPLLNMNMRLGEGTGALLAWPIIQCAAAMLRDMASFDSAGVSGPT
jgi:nicotinate-nucleotide--dimethylbenzimidazole phosphoribosyltransferase